jgi:hypothetical protein
VKRFLLSTFYFLLCAVSALAYYPKSYSAIEALVSSGYGSLTAQRCREIGTTVENCPSGNFDACYSQLQAAATSDERNFAASLFTGTGPNAVRGYSFRWDLIDWAGSGVTVNMDGTLSIAASVASVLASKSIYVDAVLGNDSGANIGLRGREDRAFASLSGAASVAQAGDRIEILTDITYSGAATFSVPVTIEGHGHKITSASQTDTNKISLNADGCSARHIEINGTWDHSSSGTTTGGAITVGAKRVTLDDIYVHDTMDNAFTVNGDWSNSVFKNLKADWCKQSGFYANSQNAAINAASEFGPITVTNTVLGKGIAIARGGAETNKVYGVNIHDIYYDNISLGTAQEGMYVHGLNDFHISHVRGSRSVYNLSCDTDINGTIDDAVIHGGSSGVYAALELAGCYRIAVSNSILDGTSRYNSTVTMTIASPAVVTWTAHGLSNGEAVKFSATGALPTGIVAGQIYYIINVTTNTFQLSNTSGGSAINTSGSQSGTHTAYWTSPGDTNNAGIQSSNISGAPLFGEFTFSNVSAFNWATGFSSQPGNGITIVGGYWSGYGSGITLDGASHLLIAGARIEKTGTSVSSPLVINVGVAATISDFRIIGNVFNASSSADSDITLSANASGATLDQATIISNTKLDTYSHSAGTVKQFAAGGASITNVVTGSNVPVGGWVNDPDPLISGNDTWTGNQTWNGSATISSSSAWTGGSLFYNESIYSTAAYSSSSAVAGIVFGFKYNSTDLINAGGISVAKLNATSGDYSSVVSLHARKNGSEKIDVFDGDPTNNVNASHLPLRIDHYTDSAAPNDSIYYSTTASKLVYKDPGGTVNPLY